MFRKSGMLSVLASPTREGTEGGRLCLEVKELLYEMQCARQRHVDILKRARSREGELCVAVRRTQGCAMGTRTDRVSVGVGRQGECVVRGCLPEAERTYSTSTSGGTRRATAKRHTGCRVVIGSFHIGVSVSTFCWVSRHRAARPSRRCGGACARQAQLITFSREKGRD